jgi:hypothetical protein
MTDVTVAPAGGAPAAAPSNEVPITPNPTQTPVPIGQQAPDKPVGDIKGSEHRPQSRREAIQEAFDRASNPQREKPPQRPAPKAAEAKKGHNQPPEDTPDEKLDLKKRPADQLQRGEHGHFAPRQPEDRTSGDASQQQQPQGQPARQPVKQLPPHAPFAEPPQRISEAARRDWAATPETVRGDIHRMHHEFGEAYKVYRADHEAMNPIRRFQHMAAQHGTTLERALTNYVGMEQKLRSDLVGGLDVIVNNLNLQTPDGQKLTLRDVAYHILNQSPEQHKLVQSQNAQHATNHQIGALHQEVAGLKNAMQQWQTAQQFTYTRSQVDQFADSHPRFDELGDLIENELRLGFDLPTAYRRAELLRPTTHAAQTRTTSAQTRNIDRSISGAPDVAPSNGASRRSEKPVGRREAIQHAMKRVNGGL